METPAADSFKVKILRRVEASVLCIQHENFIYLCDAFVQLQCSAQHTSILVQCQQVHATKLLPLICIFIC